MATKLKAADIEKAIRALVTAQETNLGIEVTVPVAFGDGELASVVIEAADGGFMAHDAGFSAMRLSAAGVSLSRHVVHRLNEYAQRYRCEFLDGRVFACAGAGDMAQAVCLVANASRSVADYIYEIRRQADYDFRATVFDRLREIVGNRMRETEEFRGASGRLYRLPIVLNSALSKPQNFLSTLAQRQVVPQSFAMFCDLRDAFPTVERDAVYDETADIRDEDRRFLSSAGAQVVALMEAQKRFREFSGVKAN